MPSHQHCESRPQVMRFGVYQTSSPLDICLASKNFYPTYAGPAVRFQRYAPGLRERGIHMRVFAGTHETRKAMTLAEPMPSAEVSRVSIGDLMPLQSVQGLDIQQVKLHDSNKLQRKIVYNRALANYCREPSNRPDLVQFLSLSLLSVFLVLRLRRLGIPLVHTHTLLGELSPGSLKRRLQRLHRRLPLQLMDCVVVSSGVMEVQLRNLGLTTRIEVIPNGVDLNRFRPVEDLSERRRLRQRLGIAPSATVLLTVGPVSPRKATDLLIEAWGRICHEYPESWLIVVGPRYDKTYPSYQQFGQRIEELVAATGASDRILFAGPVSNVEDYLRAADGFVFPSRREGMPNVVPEAMGSGLPSILTPFLGLPDEFGRPGEHYILVERSSEALARAMAMLLQYPERRRQLGLQGREWAEGQMDVKKSLDQYADLYRELVNRSD